MNFQGPHFIFSFSLAVFFGVKVAQEVCYYIFCLSLRSSYCKHVLFGTCKNTFIIRMLLSFLITMSIIVSLYMPPRYIFVVMIALKAGLIYVCLCGRTKWQAKIISNCIAECLCESNEEVTMNIKLLILKVVIIVLD